MTPFKINTYLYNKNYSASERFFIFTLLLVPIIWILEYMFHVIPERPYVSFVYHLLLSLTIFISWINRKKQIPNIGGNKIIIVFFVYNIILQLYAIIHTVLIDYKIAILSGLPSYFLILSVLAFQNIEYIKSVICIITYWVAPILSLIMAYSAVYSDGIKEVYSIYLCLMPLIIYLYGERQKKVLVSYIITVMIIFIFLTESRAISLYFILSFLLCISIKLLKLKVCKMIPRYIYIITVFFTLLAILGSYNILSNANEGENVDTRTELYVEVFDHIKKNKAYLFGTPGEGYKSYFADVVTMGERYDSMGHIYKYGRLKTETGLLNFILCGGFINILILLFLFGWISFKISKKAQNKFCINAISLASLQFPYMFIDGVWPYYFLTFFFCVMIAAGSNTQLLKKTDNEIKDYLKTF